jgi:hypothetical protein
MNAQSPGTFGSPDPFYLFLCIEFIKMKSAPVYNLYCSALYDPI